MSASPSIEEVSMDGEDLNETEEPLDTSSTQEPSKDGETLDDSAAKPKRTRKEPKRFMEEMEEEIAADAAKHKKKVKVTRKMDGDEATDNENANTSFHSDEKASDTEKEKRTRIIPGKIQCHFMESKKKLNTQCKQRAIEDYRYCIWHILNNKEAPYKRCAHLREKEKNGLLVKVQCKTAIRDISETPYCLAHSERKKEKLLKKKRKIGDLADPSPSSTLLSGPSPMPATMSNVVSPSSSIFNLPNEEFDHAINEAIGNMNDMDNMDNLMDTFDNFDSIDNLDDDDDEEEEVKKQEEPDELPFQFEELYIEDERSVVDYIVLRPFTVGKKLIDRVSEMRKTYQTPGFWSASEKHPEVPRTPQEYERMFHSEARFDGIHLSPHQISQIEQLMAEKELHEELRAIHRTNMELLNEMNTMQRSVLNVK